MGAQLAGTGWNQPQIRGIEWRMVQHFSTSLGKVIPSRNGYKHRIPVARICQPEAAIDVRCLRNPAYASLRRRHSTCLLSQGILLQDLPLVAVSSSDLYRFSAN
jgi:hypothetical protein